MEAQRERARPGASFGARRTATSPASPSTSGSPPSWPSPQFLGYALAGRARADPGPGRRTASGGREARQGETVEIILDRTPAYAESGGQMGDTGSIIGREGQGQIEDTYYRGRQLIVHRVRVTQGQLREDEEVAVTVESRRRQGLRQHHTGTHLLHAALRKVLGTHVAQAGSLVAPDHLRFDFSHGASRQGQRGRAGRGPGQRAGAGQHRGEPGRDGSAGGAPQRRHGAVRREVRRPRARHPDRRLLHRAVRRHPSRRHRPDRPLQGGRRGRGGLRRAPHRGGDGRGRARATWAARRPRCASRRACSRSRRSSCPAASQKLLDEQKQLEKQLAAARGASSRASQAQDLVGRREAGGGRAGARRASRRPRPGRAARGGGHAARPAAARASSCSAARWTAR